VAGNKHDNGVHEQGTDETRKAYQEDTPGQSVEKYVKENQKSYHDSKKTSSKRKNQSTRQSISFRFYDVF